MKYRDRLVPVSVILDGMVYIASGSTLGYHRVPNVNRNSDGDFKFNLDNFENDWNDNYVLLAFCHSFVSPTITGGSFVSSVFFPSTEHATNLIE